MEQVVELPQGDIVEVRRGSSDALARLTNDMARLNRSGHIRIERRPKGIMPRVSQIVLREGKPTIALHEADILLTGLEALLEIESDCSALDSTISLHELTREDVDLIVNLYPTASLDLDAEHISNHREGDGEWWTNARVAKSTWKREERLPELEPSVEAPEFIRLKSKAMLERHGGVVEMLNPGQGLIFDSHDPAKLLQLTGYLASHGRPVLVISRHEVDELNDKYNLPIESCSWLSNNETDNSLDPSLESIRIKIDAFLWGNVRAVVAFEGLEYLAGIHGDDRMIGLIRDICDGIKLEDHLLLVTADLSAFELKKRQLIIRELDEIKPETMDYWTMDAESILDHPICAIPTEDEIQWIESQLKMALGDEIASQNNMADSMHEMTGGADSLDLQEVNSATGNLSAMMQDWAEDSENETQTPHLESIPVSQGPSDDWKPTFHSANTADDPVNVLNEHPDSDTTIEAQVSEQLIEEKVEKVVVETIAKTTTGPRKATVIKRNRKKSMLPPIINRAHTMQANAAVQVAKDSPEFPQQRMNEQSEKHLSMTIQNSDIKQRKALDEIFQPVSYEQDNELQQASVQSAAKRIVTLPPTGEGPNTLNGITDRMPVGTETNLTPAMDLESNEITTQNDSDVREAASRSQSEKSLSTIIETWDEMNAKLLLDNSTLYDEEGNPIERYGGQ